MSVTPASNVTWNVLPSPGRRCSRRHGAVHQLGERRLIASPSPVPPNRRLVEASTW
jgi:hypothetical protein